MDYITISIKEALQLRKDAPPGTSGKYQGFAEGVKKMFILKYNDNSNCNHSIKFDDDKLMTEATKIKKNIDYV